MHAFRYRFCLALGFLLIAPLAQAQKTGDEPDSQQTKNSSAILADSRPAGDNGLLDVDRLNDLVDSYLSKGENARALSVARQALDLVQQQLDADAAVDSERQQIRLESQLRRQLDRFLTAALITGLSPSEVYQSVLTWKGNAFLRQRKLRETRRLLAGDPEATSLINDVQAKARELAAFYNACEERKQPVDGNKRIYELNEQFETAERRLVAKSHGMVANANKKCTPETIKQSLPDDAALIDVLEFTSFSKTNPSEPRSAERRVVAFVVRKKQTLAIVDLGPSEPIRQAVNDWREMQLPREQAGDNTAPPKKELTSAERAMGAQHAGELLRQMVWEKLTPYLEGCSTVLVSPDGALASISWGALPGKQPGEYLIEDIAIAVIPVPQILPELLGTSERSSTTDSSAPSLLVVGNVDLYGDPGVPESHATPQIPKLSERVLDKFGSLPMSKAQVLAIRDRFQTSFPKGTVTVLTGNQATEQTIRDLAPLSTYIHFATHGYYFPPETNAGSPYPPKQVSEQAEEMPGIATLQPEVMCGINLVGTYRYVQAGKDDGRLTAIEVKTLDLESVELVTLCACQTAMGVSVDGEGIFGLQRAFQEAGVRSTITTLWSIPVVTSDPLMVDFYDNLWIKKMSRLEALRQAQIKILRSGAQYVAKDKGRPMPGPEVRLPPFFWAGFVLAGDWR